MNDGLVPDGTVATDGGKLQALWALREGIAEAVRHEGTSYHVRETPCELIKSHVCCNEVFSCAAKLLLCLCLQYDVSDPHLAACIALRSAVLQVSHGSLSPCLCSTTSPYHWRTTTKWLNV